MAVSVNLGGTLGERLLVAVVIVGLVGEMLSDNDCNPEHQPDPMTLEECRYTCYPRPIRRLGSWECECEPEQPAP